MATDGADRGIGIEGRAWRRLLRGGGLLLAMLLLRLLLPWLLRGPLGRVGAVAFPMVAAARPADFAGVLAGGDDRSDNEMAARGLRHVGRQWPTVRLDGVLHRGRPS